ncbi:MAG: cyclodeaminase/cyclohydrolase family protein [Eggerthellaceae bacterium]|nr:cyclodeaminase/cyclohydrolase family protein [Eggerthellaceae bacterium]
MADKMMEKSCIEFVDALAAKVSVPGGGGAAAYAGALGVALGNMAANFTIGKKKYAKYEDDIRRIIAEGDEIRARLIDLVSKDAEAFEPLSRAYAIPKEDPTHDEALEAALTSALSAPLEMMRQIARAIELLEELSVKGSRLLISDVACGAVLSAAAMRAASVNVFVNTKYLLNRELAAQVETEADSLLAYVSRAEAVADQIIAGIRE